jgi:hypothetical protein
MPRKRTQATKSTKRSRNQEQQRYLALMNAFPAPSKAEAIPASFGFILKISFEMQHKKTSMILFLY